MNELVVSLIEYIKWVGCEIILLSNAAAFSDCWGVYVWAATEFSADVNKRRSDLCR